MTPKTLGTKRLCEEALREIELTHQRYTDPSP